MVPVEFLQSVLSAPRPRRVFKSPRKKLTLTPHPELVMPPTGTSGDVRANFGSIMGNLATVPPLAAKNLSTPVRLQ